MPRVERLERILEHDLDPAALVERARAGGAVQLRAVKRDPARGGLVQAGDAAADGGLAAAGLTHQRHALTRLDPERDVMHRRAPTAGAAIHHLQVGHLQQRRDRLSAGSGLRDHPQASGAPLGDRDLVPAAAAHLMLDGSRRQLGHRRVAALLGVLAPRRKRTSSRPLSHPDRNAGDSLQRPGMQEVGNRLHQSPRVGMPGTFDHVGRRPLLHHPAGVHDHDPIGHLGDHGEVVRDVHHCHPLLVAQPDQLGQDPVLGEHVQAGGGLVQHRHRRLAHRRHRDRHPLLLATRELVRVAMAEVRIDAQLDPSQGGPHGLLRGLLSAMGTQHIHDRITDPQRGVERPAGILRDVRDHLAAHASHRFRIAPDDALTGHLDGAAADVDARLGVAQERQRGGGLAAARLPHQAQDLPRPDVEADVLHHRFAAVQRQRQILDMDHRRRAHITHVVGTFRIALGTYDRPRLRAIASPVRLTPIVSRAIIAAGASTAHGFSEMY